MNDYKSVENVSKLIMASQKMLKERLSIQTTETEIKQLIEQVISNKILHEYENMHLTISELNNITLLNIKKYYESTHTNEARLPPPIENNIANERIDEETIAVKLRAFEASRKIIPSYNTNLFNNEVCEVKNTMHSIPQIIPQIVPQIVPQIDVRFKTLIINSINRDWIRTPARNNMKFNIPLDLNNNVLYPESLIFPKYVKNITPYVLMNITDGIKNCVYSFTCVECSSEGKWDVWKTIDKPENILLNNKQWSVKFFDFTNNELDLEKDNINVIEAFKEQNKYILKIPLDIHSYNNNFKINDMVMIKVFSGKQFYKKLVDYCKADSKDKNINIMTILDDKNELNLEDFVNSKILNLNNQISLVIKYHMK
jgi:hypothetical protein